MFVYGKERKKQKFRLYTVYVGDECFCYLCVIESFCVFFFDKAAVFFYELGAFSKINVNRILAVGRVAEGKVVVACEQIVYLDARELVKRASVRG